MNEKELLQWLKNETDDPFFKVFDKYFKDVTEDYQRAIEVASIPHWFDEGIFKGIVDKDIQHDPADLYKFVTEMPFCESYDARNGYNVKKAIRLAVRIRLMCERPERFEELSARAAEAFTGHNLTYEVERIFHLLWTDAAFAGEKILALENELARDSAKSLALASSFQECKTVDCAKYPLVFGLSLIHISEPTRPY